MANTRGKRKETLPVDEAMNNIKNTPDDMTQIATPLTENGIVNCHALNVRKAPSKEAAILTVIPKDAKVKILDNVNEKWYKVRVPENTTGFCMKEFITIK